MGQEKDKVFSDMCLYDDKLSLTKYWKFNGKIDRKNKFAICFWWLEGGIVESISDGRIRIHRNLNTCAEYNDIKFNRANGNS